jgi:hypothetical protein
MSGCWTEQRPAPGSCSIRNLCGCWQGAPVADQMRSAPAQHPSVAQGVYQRVQLHHAGYTCSFNSFEGGAPAHASTTTLAAATYAPCTAG